MNLLITEYMQYEYDANGNMISKVDSSNPSDASYYTYDIENRLVQITISSLPSTISYYYDPFGRRLWKEVDGTTTYFMYADEGLVAELDETGTETKTYGYVPNSTWTTDPLFMEEDGNYYFYHNDHLGTPQKMTSVNGAEVWSAKYSAFGEADVDAESTVVNNLRFPGQYYDSENNLRYNRHRYYDSTIGRYISTDPIGIKGGMNYFLYANNNPIKNIDESGLVCGSGPTEIIIADKPYNYDFTEACKFHDECYANCGMSKRYCDLGLFSLMVSQCNEQLKYSRRIVIYNCYRIALQYYIGVTAFGHVPYKTAQKHCKCQ